jgi:hypothetical protein
MMVAGLHRASPSASLDKSHLFNLMSYCKLVLK